jgi:hypothetical protein
MNRAPPEAGGAYYCFLRELAVMNMDRKMIERSRYAAGLATLDEMAADRDISQAKKDAELAVCKGYFIATYLEALAEVPWTSARKRRRLLKTMKPHSLTGYRFVYDLPDDCARPIELLDKTFFVIEGALLATDAAKAELLYTTTGWTHRGINFESADIGDSVETVLSPGHVDEWDIPPDAIFNPLNPEDYPHGTVDYTDEQGSHVVLESTFPAGWDVNDPDRCELLPRQDTFSDDYPMYDPPQLEPKFWEYVEALLAAKFAMNNSKNPRQHDTLLQKALLIKQDAISATRSASAARQQPSPWWSDQLGLGQGR